MPFERRRHPFDAAGTWHRWALLTDGRFALVRDEQKEHLEALSRRIGSARLDAELLKRGSETHKRLAALGRAPLVEQAATADAFFDDKEFEPTALAGELRAIAGRQRVELSDS